MELTSPRFKANVRDALKKPNLKTAMGRLIGTMGPRRLAARAGLP